MGGPWGIEQTGAKEPGNIGETLSAMFGYSFAGMGYSRKWMSRIFSLNVPQKMLREGCARTRRPMDAFVLLGGLAIIIGIIGFIVLIKGRKKRPRGPV